MSASSLRTADHTFLERLRPAPLNPALAGLARRLQPKEKFDSTRRQCRSVAYVDHAKLAAAGSCSPSSAPRSAQTLRSAAYLLAAQAGTPNLL
eukprot:5362859-Alexandrium_andersonii.AAC.1